MIMDHRSHLDKYLQRHHRHKPFLSEKNRYLTISKCFKHVQRKIFVILKVTSAGWALLMKLFEDFDLLLIEGLNQGSMAFSRTYHDVTRPYWLGFWPIFRSWDEDFAILIGFYRMCVLMWQCDSDTSRNLDPGHVTLVYCSIVINLTQ